MLTPDFDMHEEQIALENMDLLSYKIGVGLGLPAGLDGGNTYRFRGLPDGPTMEQFRRDARQAAAAMIVRPGMAVAAVGGAMAAAPLPVAAAAGAGDAAEAEVWVRIETEDGHERGEIVELDGTEALHGHVGIKTKDGKAFVIRKLQRGGVEAFKGKEGQFRCEASQYLLPGD